MVFKTFMRLLKRSAFVIVSYALIFFFISVLAAPSQPRSDEATKPDFDASKSLRFCVRDLDGSEASQNLIAYLEQYYTRVELKNREAKAVDEAIMTGTVDAALTIYDDFEGHLARGEKACSVKSDERRFESQWLCQKLGQYLQVFYALQDSGSVDQQELEEILEPEVHFVFPKSESLSADRLKSGWYEKYFMFFQYIYLAITMILFSDLLLQFKEGRVRNRSYVSGISHMKFQGQLLAGLLIMMALVISLFILGAVAIGGSPARVPMFPVYLLNVAVFGFVGLSMSYLFISLVSNSAAAKALANVIPLGLSFISGVMVPQEFMGDFTLGLAKAFPVYYYVRVVEDRPNRNMNLMIQLLFGLVYLILALVLNRVRKKDEVAF